MGFLERAIKRGVSNAIGNAVEQGVRRAVEPKIEEAAASVVNKAADKINEAAGMGATEQQATGTLTPDSTPRASVNQESLNQAAGVLGGLFGAMQNAANEAAKNMKICPSCGQPAKADQKFCPSCGEKLPETTVAQGAICPSCGKQNSIGMKFCADCGTKLPAAVAEEQAAANRNAAVLAEWGEKLPQYPKWSCGGDEIYINDYDENGYSFGAVFKNNPDAAHRAVEEYRQILLANGFRQAGQYPSMEQLFKRIDGVVYNVDTEHCFEGDPDCACIGFCVREPYGGFDYVKPEPKKKTSWKDLLGL